MEKHTAILFLLALILILTGRAPLRSYGGLLPVVDDQGGEANRIQTYIIHVMKPEGSQLLSDQDLEDWHRSFLPNTTLDSGEPRLVYSYRHAISGFAARLTPEEVRAMEAMEGFLSAESNRPLALQTTYTPTFLGLNQWNGLWKQPNHGEGIIIGVLDSGIATSHPSFNDDDVPAPPKKWRGRCDLNASDCNNKLIGARTFISRSTEPPVDFTGHGTMVASIAAGNFVYDAEFRGNARGNASGMAPKAHLSIYRVCWHLGSCRPEDVLAAIDQAIHDGVDVLNLSIGHISLPFYVSDFYKGMFSAMEKGILPVAAAGNEGPLPKTIENDIPWALTVGASTTDRIVSETIRLGNGVDAVWESGYQDPALNATVLPVVYSPKHCRPGTLDSIDAQGKVVVCRMSRATTDAERSKVVKDAGGAAVIVLNLEAEWNTTFAVGTLVPVIHVNHVEALRVYNYVRNATNPTATIALQGTKFGFKPFPTIAEFSCRGPSFSNGGIIKPDIVAPGFQILGAFKVEPNPNWSSKSAFHFDSGTSMATPHVAGVAALLKRSHPQWSPAAIKSAIMTTALRLDSDGKPILDQYRHTHASVFAMGAGHLNPSGANDPGLIYDLHAGDYIPYLCGLGYSDTNVSTIIRRPIQCSKVGSISAEQLNYPSIMLNLTTKPHHKTVTRTVTNVGEANSVYRVHVDEPKGVEVHVSPETLSFNQLNEKKSFQVKFSKSNHQGTDQYSEGQLYWTSSKHVVRSPMAVKMT